jgi:hypothetical protein
MDFLDLLGQFGLQLLFTVGLIVIVGLTVAGAKHFFLRSCGRAGYHIELVSGAIGTPIHELSHALFCLIFGHKIEAIRLYTPRDPSGTLGYVSHSYRKRNLWHRIGNFFIGVGPLIGGSGVLLLLMWLLVPNASAVLFDTALGSAAASKLTAIPSAIGERAWGVLRALFLPANFSAWQWYLFLILTLPIVLHMKISGSDLKSGLLGFLFLAGIWLACDLLLFFLYPTGLYALTAGCMYVGVFLSSFFLLALGIAAILILVSIPMRLLRRR